MSVWYHHRAASMSTTTTTTTTWSAGILIYCLIGCCVISSISASTSSSDKRAPATANADTKTAARATPLTKEDEEKKSDVITKPWWQATPPMKPLKTHMDDSADNDKDDDNDNNNDNYNDIDNDNSCLALYERGVAAYLENNYPACVRLLEDAVTAYREYTYRLQRCRLRCHRETAEAEPLGGGRDVEDLRFYERAVRNTLCIVRCKSSASTGGGGGGERRLDESGGGFAYQYNVDAATVELFEKRKPYEYLHVCYYQTKQYDKIASATFTYLVQNPDDEAMQANLKFYSTLPEVDMTSVVNYEAKDYVSLYIHGAEAYDRKEFPSVVSYMEESLLSYLQSEDECRALCEGPFDQGWYPDLIPAISNHFTFALRCKQNCSSKLNSLNGERHDDLLPSHYHFLQFAYFKLGKLKEACTAVASYLLFYPLDETMMANMEFYKTMPKVDKNYFKPRPEAVDYIYRRDYEKKILKFIFKEFQYNDDETNKVSQLCNQDQPDPGQFKVTKSPRELGGRNRFVADNVISPEDCLTLTQVAREFALSGDGYTAGNASPHTADERFGGVTVERAIQLTHVGLMGTHVLRLLLAVTYRVKRYMEWYLQPSGRLYFTFTHLVCRSAVTDLSTKRSEFSHRIHADNCNLRKDGTCTKSKPAYVWRDYSAILYLNDEFSGGEFVFADDYNGQHLQSTVVPKCGRMVAFTSGSENMHGVKAVTNGSRFAIGIWFTFDPNHAELDRNYAYEILQ